MNRAGSDLDDGAHIRRLTMEDIPEVVAIERRVSPFPWSEQQFTESLDFHYCRALEYRQNVAGYLIYSIVADVAEILNIAVAPELQGNGYGKRLLSYIQEQVAEQVQSVFLEVRVSNFAAINLYLADGFNQIGERRNYYRTAYGKEDALVMAKEIL